MLQASKIWSFIISDTTNKVKFSAFYWKGVIYFWQRIDAIFEDVTAAKTVNAKISNKRHQSFSVQNITISDTCNKYKGSNSQHGKPEMSYETTRVPLS